MNSTEIRSQLDLIRKDVNLALAVIAEKHGLKSLGLGKGTFNENGCTFKLECVFAGGASKDEQRYDDLRRYHPELPARDSDARFLTNGRETLELVGANTTGSKIIAKHADGKQYLYRTDAILGMIARAQRDEKLPGFSGFADKKRGEAAKGGK